MKPLISLSKKDIDNMSNTELCNRMDDVLFFILHESYTDKWSIENFPRQSIKEFFTTKKIQSLSNEHQRLALRKCFEYLTQHEYLSRVSGWLNDAVFGSGYDLNSSWSSPRIHSLNSANIHIKITASTVALEKFQDLLYIIESGKKISDEKKGNKNSKFNFFKKWLLNSQNKFVFFAPSLIPISKFKSKFRTAEVHESSRLPNLLLQLQKPSFEDLNAPLELINILFSMWEPLLIFLNDQTPLSTAGSCSDLEWLKAIQENNFSKIQNMLNEINTQLK